MQINSVGALLESRNCSCEQMELAFIISNDDPGYSDAQAAMVQHLLDLIRGVECNVSVYDLGSSVSLYSQKRLARIFRGAPATAEAIKLKHENLQVFDLSGTKPLPLPISLREPVSHAIQGDLFSILKHDSISRSPLAKLIRFYLWRRAEQAYGLSCELFENKHHCLAVILNGRHTVDTVLKLCATNAGASALFWENSPSGRGRLFFANHQPQDYFAFREESRKALGTKIDFSETLDWLESRRSNENGSNPYASKFSPQSLVPKRGSSYAAVMFSSSQDERWALGGLAPKKQWDDQYDGFTAVARKLDPSFRIVLRMHPNTLNKSPTYILRETIRIDRMMSEIPNLSLVLPASRVSSYSLVEDAELVVTSSSTIGAEAAVLGKRVVHLNLSKYMLTSEKTLFDGMTLPDESKHNLQEIKKTALTEFWVSLSHECVDYQNSKRTKRPFRTLVSLNSWLAVYILIRSAIAKTVAGAILAPLALKYRSRLFSRHRTDWPEV